MERGTEAPSAVAFVPARVGSKRVPGKNVRVLGDGPMNQSLERAGRVADFFELGELMVRDALTREESCGGHFREESQTPEGEALRNDDEFAHVAAWEWTGDPMAATRHQEDLVYDTVHFQTRSYK